MVNPELQKFCRQWFVVQTTAMNTMFRLLGELSNQQTLAIKDRDQKLFDLVTDMRKDIVEIVVDETNLTERTSGYEKVFHNDLFKISAEKAGVTFPPVNEIETDFEVGEFLNEISSIDGYEDLFAFMRATEHEAENIFEKMKVLFQNWNAPKEAYGYIDVHLKIESLHDDESEAAQDKYNMSRERVDKYIQAWRKVLTHLNLT